MKRPAAPIRKRIATAKIKRTIGNWLEVETARCHAWKHIMHEVILPVVHAAVETPGPLATKYGLDSMQARVEVDTAIVDAILSAAGFRRSGESAVEGNPLLVAHSFISKHMPVMLTKTWSEPPQCGMALQDTADADVRLLRLLSSSVTGLQEVAIAGATAPEKLLVLENADCPGEWVSAAVEDVLQLVQKPLQNSFSSAVPCKAALDAIATVAQGGVVELGAGSGYWAALLHEKGVDVLCYDIEPPTIACKNRFFAAQFFRVRHGGPNVLCKRSIAQRTLLLIWPWCKDMGGLPPYDAAALRMYRGDTVVHVGDLQHPGITTSREAVDVLEQYFTLAREVDIPHWPHSRDMLSIWHRNNLWY